MVYSKIEGLHVMITEDRFCFIKQGSVHTICLSTRLGVSGVEKVQLRLCFFVYSFKVQNKMKSEWNYVSFATHKMPF